MPDTAAGKDRNCPNCGAPFDVPDRPDSPEIEADGLKARLARVERMLFVLGGLCAFLFAAVCFLAIGHGGKIARLQARADGAPAAPAPVVPQPPFNPVPPAPTPAKIDATSFVLRDSRGRARIMMGINPDDSAAFGLMGPTNDSNVAIVAHGDGVLAMAFTQGNVPAITLSAKPDGEAGILVGSRYRVAIAGFPHKDAKVFVSDANGKIVGEFP